MADTRSVPALVDARPRAARIAATATVRRVAPHLPIALLIAAYFARFALLSVQVQDGYGAPGYDMGIFDQGVWLLSRFHTPFVTVMGRNLFGDHTSFVLVLAVPLYWIWPEAQTLLVLQSALIALAAVPIYILARRRLVAGGAGRATTTVTATVLAGAYLLNPALQHGNLEQFHPECFLVLFVAVAILAAVEWHPRILAVAIIGCLLVKEDTALLVVPLGVWIYFRRSRSWGVGIVAGAAAYTAVAYEVVIASLLGTTSFYANRIPFGGLGGLATAPVAHPGKFWSYAVHGYRPFYVWQMGASFGWTFLLSPEIALIGVLTFAENVLSDFPYMQQILYHYSLPLVPVFAMGTAFAVTALRRPRLRAAATTWVAVVAIVSCSLWGLAPFSRHPVYPHAAPDSPSVLAVNRALAVIPPKAVVSAAYPFVSHLDHRTRIYQWPTPFRAEYWGLYRQEGQRLPFAGQVQWVVIPSQLTGTDAAAWSAVESHFQLVASGGGISVYRRASAGP